MVGGVWVVTHPKYMCSRFIPSKGGADACLGAAPSRAD
jgi:hypothetical protein